MADSTEDTHSMHSLLRRLFPICRSITGEGVRETLRILRGHMPGLRIHEVPTGTPCFDWEVPPEWNITAATLTGPDGQTLADFKDHNLHVVSYSEPVDLELSLDELQPHLHSLPAQPDAIPYVTSYYRRDWGFCLADRVRRSLQPGRYRAIIRSTLENGSLTYGELVLPGETTDEILVSTYICHPSMANNELSGPVVATWLAKHLAARPRRHTLRFIFIPETIGSLVYLSRHLDHLKKHVKAGLVLSCVGDERAWSWLSSRLGGTLADKAAAHVMRHLHPEHHAYSWLHRGSDERQFCWPGVDLPVCSFMRSKYATYPEYHTSLDNPGLVTEAGLRGSFDTARVFIECIERNQTYRATTLGEPRLGKRDLYPAASTIAPEAARAVTSARTLVDILAYCDGAHDLLDVAERLGKPVWELFDGVQTLMDHHLLRPA
ncbi:MAG TPA: DUF4910 domain-containing protein [Prosthecobacter sp.]|nr:DUF4910 domain-containing protein [Prosthecobacter sp.]HRK16805.1 DUF4910 domain-containing protein [Prosthecobacter sp.]